MFENAAFTGELERLAKSRQCSREELFDQARDCLDELAVRPTPRYLGLVTRLARFMTTRSYEPEIDINHTELERLKEIAGDHPLVFLWSHKSHLDSFVFLRAIYDSNFRPQPLSFAGINMAFSGLNALARRSGAIFLRRSFQDDPVYKLVFKHYIDYLVASNAPLSWSIEGTRSRTGKLMPPRLGLLKWVIDSCQRASRDDVLLVPVSISFDQVAEMDDYIAMQQGLPKRKESLRWFIGYISGMKARNGRVYVRFAEPVTLSDSAQVAGEILTGHGSQQKLRTQKVAIEVCRRIEHATPVTVTSIVALVLLAANGQPLTEAQIRDHASQIASLVTKQALPTTSKLGQDCADDLSHHLKNLCESGLLEPSHQGEVNTCNIAPGKQLAAAWYRNTVAHYFLNQAIAEVSLAAQPPQDRSIESLRQGALALRDLLKFEFFFKSKKAFLADVEAFLGQRYPQWSDPAVTQQALFTAQAPLFGPGILRTFMESYLVLARMLERKADLVISERDNKILVQQCQQHGQKLLERNKIASEAALSQSLFASAIKLAQHRGLLDGEPLMLEQGRNAFRAEVAEAVTAINHLQHYHEPKWS